MTPTSREQGNEKPKPILSLPPSPQLTITEIEESESKPALAVSRVEEQREPDLIPSQPQPHLQPQSQLLLQLQQDYDPSVGAKPYSPFYRHATPSSRIGKLSLQPKRSRSLGIASPIDEIEGSGPPPWQRLYDEEARNNRESKLWMQKKKYCDCLGGLSKAQRMALKIVVAVLIVGSMVAIALGITAAVGGGVWSGDHQSERVG
ncbi:hypothetical protein BJX76DRAFT_359988 [Aspergillus varians]